MAVPSAPAKASAMNTTLMAVKIRAAIQNLARLMRPLKVMKILTKSMTCPRHKAAMETYPLVSGGDRVSRKIASKCGYSVSQQFVDAGLGAGLLVDALDDDGAIEVRAGLAVGHWLAGERAGHHHRIGRHLALEHLPGGAVDDLGRGAEIDAHRQHRALAHDHAFGDLGARADEAVVLDDHRVGLQRLQHAADADAAGEMTVLADLGAGADRGPGVAEAPCSAVGA